MTGPLTAIVSQIGRADSRVAVVGRAAVGVAAGQHDVGERCHVQNSFFHVRLAPAGRAVTLTLSANAAKAET